MKIAVFISEWPVYYLQFLNSFLEEIACKDNEVTLIVESVGRLPGYTQNIKVIDLGLRKSENSIYGSNVEKLENMALNENFDVLIGVEKYGFLNSLVCSKKNKSIVIYWSFEIYDLENPGVYRNNINNLFEIERNEFHNVDIFIIQDKIREKCYFDIVGIKKIPKNVFHFPICISELDKSQNISRKLLKIPEQSKILLYIGQISENRYVNKLIEQSIYLNDDEIIYIHGPLLGDKKILNEYKKNLPDNVIVSIEDYNDSELFSLAGLADVGFIYYRNLILNDYHTGRSSTKLALYLKSGIPVICPKYPTFKSDIEKYHYGISINDTNGIVDSFHKILENYNYYKDGVAEISQNIFDINTNINKLIKLIISLNGNNMNSKINISDNSITKGFSYQTIMENAEKLFNEGNFQIALNKFMDIYADIKDNEDINLRILFCMLRLNQMDSARNFLLKLVISQPNNEKYLNLITHFSIKIKWEDVLNLDKINLYAGDITKSIEYTNLVGLSITKNDHKHIKHNILDKLPIPDNSIDSYQAEDVFEHIPINQLPDVINEIYRVLKNGAHFRLSIPDYRSDILINRSELDKFGNVVFDPGGGGTKENPGHLWYPKYEIVKELIEKTKFAENGEVIFYHYYDEKGQPVTNQINHTKGFVKRTPDHDIRVQKPYRPLSIVVDLIKGKRNESSENRINEKPITQIKNIDENSINNQVKSDLNKKEHLKISFITIVLNGMPFIKAMLESIYEFAYEIIVVEGAIENCKFAANQDGSSIDGTVEFIMNYPDPQNKIKIMQGLWPEKCEMQNAALDYVEGDYIWLVDSDEIYKKEDIRKIIELLESDKNITQVNFISSHNFWKGFDYYFVSPEFFKPQNHYRRIFKFEKDAYFTTHRPPTLFYPSINKNSEEICLIDGFQTLSLGIIFYHYSYVNDLQVNQKIELYNRYGWGKSWKIDLNDWYKNFFLKWNPSNRIDLESKYPAWTGSKDSYIVKFIGTHPESINNLLSESLSKNNDGNKNIVVDSNNFDEIKTAEIIGSPYYMKKVLEAWSRIQIDEPIKYRYKDIENYLKNGKPFWNIHVALAYTTIKLKPRTYLEVGVRIGGSMVQVLNAGNLISVTAVDLWAGEYANLPNTLEYTKQQLLEFENKSGKSVNIQFLKGKSQNILKNLISKNKKYELITIDGDHNYDGAEKDLEAALLLLDDKGAIVFDDIIHPSHKYLLDLAYTFAERHKLQYVINTFQDNGCIIFLKGISVAEFLNSELANKKNTPKIAGEVKSSHDLTSISKESDFSYSIEQIFRNIKPAKIIETGTYLGNGTTKIICNCLKSNYLNNSIFYSIEINPRNIQKAKVNLQNSGLIDYVRLLNGISVPPDILPTKNDIIKTTVDSIEFDNIYIDHSETERVDKYFNETYFPNMPNDLLGKCMREFNYQPDFVLLDSAGHMGFIEFKYLLSLLKGNCIIALDDIYHIKHHKSYILIKSDPRFDILAESTEKFGFCIARFIYE
jgi:predicted O-methyltransferase YrrM/predicted SAM-dependent methyltransferase